MSGGGIHSDERGHIAELAFGRHAQIVPHTNPNTTFFIVIEGGGFVLVGDEEARVAAGECVTWPANVLHGARTELTPMRALVVEFSTVPPSDAHRLLLDGRAERIDEGAEAPSRAQRAEGRLAPKPPVGQSAHESPDREPW